MKLEWIAVAMALMVGPSLAGAEQFALTAPRGQYLARTLAPHAPQMAFAVRTRLTEFRGTLEWPSAAMVGFHQGADRQDSVQFYVSRLPGANPYLVVGYKLVVAGREEGSGVLAKIPLEAVTRFELRFDHGAVLVLLNEETRVEVTTPFTEVSPYVSVASGTAEFQVDGLLPSRVPKAI